MNWIIRTFGLEGSWKWACRQMQNGECVRPSSALGAIKYKLDTEGQGRILWTFNTGACKDAKWESAYMFLHDFEATDWVCV